MFIIYLFIFLSFSFISIHSLIAWLSIFSYKYRHFIASSFIDLLGLINIIH